VLQVLEATEADIEFVAKWNVEFRKRMGDEASPEESHKMARSWIAGPDGNKAYLLSVRSTTAAVVCLSPVLRRVAPHL
jgi:hypothetical protein